MTSHVDYARNEVYLEGPDPLEEDRLDQAFGERVGLLRWSLPVRAVKVEAVKVTARELDLGRRVVGAIVKLPAQARALLQAQLSGPTPPDVLKVRRLSCFGVVGFEPPCPELVVEPSGRYCGRCGCPRTRWSELDNKLAKAGTSCPLRRPGFPNSEVTT